MPSSLRLREEGERVITQVEYHGRGKGKPPAFRQRATELMDTNLTYAIPGNFLALFEFSDNLFVAVGFRTLTAEHSFLVKGYCLFPIPVFPLFVTDHNNRVFVPLARLTLFMAPTLW